MIESSHAAISIRRQCDLIGLDRSTLYYHPAGESPLNLELMRLIDEQYTKTPFYGWPRMTAQLHRLGYEVNHKRVHRLMQLMGLQAVYPKPRTTVPDKEHKIYPYLLRDLEICRPITFGQRISPISGCTKGSCIWWRSWTGFPRFVIAWELSNTLDGLFWPPGPRPCSGTGAARDLQYRSGVQFSAMAFTAELQSAGIRISMDGRGRALDNIFVERLWRSVKYEDATFGTTRPSPRSAKAGNVLYLYNSEPTHQSLGYRTPAEVHYAH